MAAITDAIFGLDYGRPLGESGWNDDYNDVVQKMSTLLMLSVTSATTTAEPGSPTDGDRYLLPASATGTNWAGNDDSIAVYIVDTWVFYAPGAINEGWRCAALDSGQFYQWDGDSWELEASLYGSYADDTAAATGSVPVGGVYVNSTTGAIHRRLT